MELNASRWQEQSLSNGNLRASVGGDGALSYHRVSDGALLLREAGPRTFAPSAAARGYYELTLALRGQEGERYYGLGQHQSGALGPARQAVTHVCPARCL